MSVKVRISKTKAALQKMTDACIARGIAESLQGKVILAEVQKDGSAYIVAGQGWPEYILPHGTFSVFVSRAAALAQTKQLARYKATPRRNRK